MYSITILCEKGLILDWQTAVALGIVAVAGITLLPKFFKLFRANEQTGCGHCGGCSSGNEKIIHKPLIGLNDIADNRK